MTDRMTKGQRSHTMSRIRGRDTGPELILRRKLWKDGARGYRTHPKGVPGSPDLAFMRQKVAVFVDGCFWHRCPRCYRPPSSNIEFWRSKAQRNVDRDRKVDSELAEAFWKVIRVWEHEIRENPEAVAKEVHGILLGSVDKAGELHRLRLTRANKSSDLRKHLDKNLSDNRRNRISNKPVGMTHRDSEHKPVWE